MSTKILELEAALKVLTIEEKQEASLARNKPTILRVGLTLGKYGLRALSRLMPEKFQENGPDPSPRVIRSC